MIRMYDPGLRRIACYVDRQVSVEGNTHLAQRLEDMRQMKKGQLWAILQQDGGETEAGQVAAYFLYMG